MNTIKETQSARIDVADVIRGFSVLGILLLHCIEHFNFYKYPEVANEWLRFSDKAVWDSLFFMFGGKAYAIFALLFGFSFFIQDNSQLKRGKDFRLRFFWRLVLLFVWGNINAIFFTGEILVLYSITGIALLFVARLKTRTVLIIAIILLLQPVEWGKLAYALLNPDYIPAKSAYLPFWKAANAVQGNGTFLETVRVNLWEGQLFSLIWAWENGRFLQTPALFMFGMLVGRTALFIKNENNIRFWSYAALLSVLLFLPLKGLREVLPQFIENKAVLTPLNLIVKSCSDFSFMAFLVSVLVLLFYLTRFRSKMMRLAPYGRMSLTMYITQSIMGSFVFYNWGLGLADDLSITQSLLVAVVIFAIQYSFCVAWLRLRQQGPLEYVWKKATWIGAKKNHPLASSGIKE